MFVYVGSYTEAPYGDGPGISGFRFDEGTGSLTPIQTLGEVHNPSFLVVAKDGRHVYATNELPEGGVSAFARDTATGELTALNREATHGADPCYVSIDPSGRHVLAVNYTGGSVAVLPLSEDGSVKPASDVVKHTGSSVRPDRQEAAHPHMIHASPDGESIVVTDLGADAVFSYGFDAEAGKLLPRPERTAKADPGSGPRHFAFSPDGATLYVLNELTDTLTAYAWNNGSPVARQTVPALPEPVDDLSGAHVLVSPDGRFVYGSNRGHGSITVTKVDGATGELSVVVQVPTGGKTPRGFGMDPSGRWLLVANQDAGTVLTFRRNAETGLLEETGNVVEVKSPVAVIFVGA
jgi:6-phosphogluconolactonase